MPERLHEREMTGREVERVYKMEDGTERTYVVRNDKDVAVTVAFDEDGNVLLCRQFRPGQERYVDDPPGGRCEPGETPQQAAAREMLEETGYQARELIPACQYAMVTNSTRIVYGYLALECRRVQDPKPEDGEEIVIVRKSLPEFVRQVARGLVSDYGACVAALNRVLVPMLAQDPERAAAALELMRELSGLAPPPQSEEEAAKGGLDASHSQA